MLVVAETHEQAMAKVARVPEERRAYVLAGDVDEIAEQGQAYADIGIEGMTVSIPDVHDLETVELAGRALGPCSPRRLPESRRRVDVVEDVADARSTRALRSVSAQNILAVEVHAELLTGHAGHRPTVVDELERARGDPEERDVGRRCSR